MVWSIKGLEGFNDWGIGRLRVRHNQVYWSNLACGQFLYTKVLAFACCCLAVICPLDRRNCVGCRKFRSQEDNIRNIVRKITSSNLTALLSATEDTAVQYSAVQCSAV